jgi:hypothetical protein
VAEVLGDCLLTRSLRVIHRVTRLLVSSPLLSFEPLPPLMCSASASAGRRCSVHLAPPCRLHQPPQWSVQSSAASLDEPPVTRIPVVASLLGKRIARVQASPTGMLAGPLKLIRAGEPTTAAAVLQACKAVCAIDPVVSGKDGRAAAVAGRGFTSELKVEVLWQWEITKLVAVLPDYALARAVNMSLEDLATTRPERIAQYLFARASVVTPAYIAQARSALFRLLCYNLDYGVPWDGAFGQLSEVDLFSFLLLVHIRALGKASAKQPGLDDEGECGRAFITSRSGSDSSSLRTQIKLPCLLTGACAGGVLCCKVPCRYSVPAGSARRPLRLHLQPAKTPGVEVVGLGTGVLDRQFSATGQRPKRVVLW